MPHWSSLFHVPAEAPLSRLCNPVNIFLACPRAVVLVADPWTLDPVHHPRDARRSADPVRILMVHDR